MKRCTGCDEEKPLQEYRKDKGGAGGLRSRCRDCCNAAFRKYRQANREKMVAAYSKSAAPPGHAHVYVIEAGSHVKIGLARNVGSRLHDVATGCPDPCRLAFVSNPMPRAEAQQLERACHAKLADKHHRGEWFKVDAADAENVVRSEYLFAA